MSQKLKPLFSENGQRVSGLFVDQKTQTIYSITSIKNRKHKFSTKIKFPNIAKAKRVANLRLSEIFGSNKKSITPLIKDEIPKYILLKGSEGLDPKTINVIKRMMARIERFWGDMQTSEITREKVSDWFAWMDEEFSGQQRFNDVKYLRNFCRHLNDTQFNGKPMLSAIPRIVDPDHKKVIAKRKAKHGRIFTHDEFRKVYSTAAGQRERLVCLFMYTMATRIDETLGLKFGHEIALIDGKWAYRWSFGQNKADLSGYHFLHPRLVPFIEELELVRHNSGVDRLFPQGRDKSKAFPVQMIDFNDWRKRANLGWHWTSHTFRRTCLSNLFNDEKNPQALICKLYRVSLALALDVYIKPTQSGLEKMRNSLTVSI